MGDFFSFILGGCDSFMCHMIILCAIYVVGKITFTWKGKSSRIGDNEWMNLMPCKVCHFGEPYT
jgi:hypothetical protein